MNDKRSVFVGKLTGGTTVGMSCLFAAAGNPLIGAYLAFDKDPETRGWSGAEQEFRALFTDERSFFHFQGLFADSASDAVRDDATAFVPDLQMETTGHQVTVDSTVLTKGVLMGNKADLCRTLTMAGRTGDAFLRVTDFSVGKQNGSVRFAFHLADGADHAVDRRRRIEQYLKASGFLVTSEEVAAASSKPTRSPWQRDEELVT